MSSIERAAIAATATAAELAEVERRQLQSGEVASVFAARAEQIGPVLISATGWAAA